MTGISIIQGDVIEVLKDYPDESFTACFCDPPYGLKFMGKEWDHGVPAIPYWAEVLRVLKPGAVLMAFGGTRTWHRLGVAIEDAGFELFDTMMWLHGQGFPKSHSIGKALDKAAGAEREVIGQADRRSGPGRHMAALAGHRGESVIPNITAPATDAAKIWEGYGTSLKPAWEPILLVRKPRTATYAQTAMEHGSSALNIDGCRIASAKPHVINTWDDGAKPFGDGAGHPFTGRQQSGRWPANLILDEVVAEMLDAQQKGTSRFFYCAKSSRRERDAGLEEFDSTEQVCYDETLPLTEQESLSWESTGLIQAIQVATDGLQRRAIIVSAFGILPPKVVDLCLLMCMFGRKPMGRFLQALLCIISTATGKTIALKIYNLLHSWSISESTADVNSEMVYGGNHVASVENSNQLSKNIGTSPKKVGLSMEDVNRATSKLSSSKSVLEKLDKRCRRKPAHPTIKPLALCKYLATLIIPPEEYRDDANLLIPFAGVMSEAIGALLAGWRNITAIELEKEYCEIGQKRIDWWVVKIKETGLTDPKAILKRGS